MDNYHFEGHEDEKVLFVEDVSMSLDSKGRRWLQRSSADWGRAKKIDRQITQVFDKLVFFFEFPPSAATMNVFSSGVISRGQKRPVEEA